ncbi:MAG: chorismate mutase [Candidatus Pacebacteria bacterium]|nr:chorismate mutase [Candidatus Paceibacterota bacterium]
MELKEIRIKLDKIDNDLVEIVAKRIELIPEVAEYKKEHNLERYQKGREDQIITELRKKACELNVNPDLIEDLIKRIIEESHRIEKEIMKK